MLTSVYIVLVLFAAAAVCFVLAYFAINFRRTLKIIAGSAGLLLGILFGIGLFSEGGIIGAIGLLVTIVVGFFGGAALLESIRNG